MSETTDNLISKLVEAQRDHTRLTELKALQYTRYIELGEMVDEAQEAVRAANNALYTEILALATGKDE